MLAVLGTAAVTDTVSEQLQVSVVLGVFHVVVMSVVL